jgi:hypothetical protein
MNTTFILLQGTLTVEAVGYWYTGGGEKGSFGYYPHLKTDDGFPVYPDTQIHGDLRMASVWAAGLGVGCASPSRINTLFGTQGNETAALLHLGDLTLNAASREEWRKSRFDIKPRIEIDDATRSVRKNMLANFEAAWLEGLTLEAPLYAGYFNDEADAVQARELLEEAVQLLSGFGALRSRGYGRGKVRIQWQQLQSVTISPKTEGEATVSYALKSLVNLRSKPVAAERLQLIATSLYLCADQVRGWFVRTFRQVTGRWPDADEMESITFRDLFPSPSATEAAFPPANTTLRREDGGSVDDYWGRAPEGEQGDSLTKDTQGTVEIPDRKEKCKLKPLQPGTFISGAGKIHPVKAGVRMRNAMQDDFRTLEEGGLFVQQYLPLGTVFCGQVSIAEPSSDFGRLAHAILSGLKPVINGCILEPTIGEVAVIAPSNCSARLVAYAVPFNPQRTIGSQEGITIGTIRRYAPALGRPRRGRPVILPGSVLTDDAPGTVVWPLFGRNIDTARPHQPKEPPKRPVIAVPLPEHNIAWQEVTRSQAGILRELLNRDHNPAIIGKYLQDIRDKHLEKNSKSDLAKLYTALHQIHQRDGIEQLWTEVGQILDHLKAEVWWNGKKNCKPVGREA